MGCAPSSDPKVSVAEPSQNNNNYNRTNRSNNNGFKKVELKNTQDSYNQYNRPNSDKKPLAFVIEFDEKKKSGTINNRPPPGRLQLAPLGKPEMTQDKLDEKMRAAERNRENILRGKNKLSKKNGSAHSRTNGSRANSGSMGSTYYNTDSRKMSKDEVNWNNFDNHNGHSNNGYNNQNGMRRTEEDERKREKLLQRRRIERQPSGSDNEIEHNKRMSDGDEYF